MVELLADNGAKMMTKDLNEQTTLHLAVEKGDFKWKKKIAAGDFVQESYKMYSNFTAGNLEMMKFLIKSGVDVNAKDSLSRTAIHLASRKGFLFKRSP